MEKRRKNMRIPLQIFLNEYVADKAFRCMSLNLSTQGIYLNRLNLRSIATKPIIGLEFKLPETSDVIWAKGEIRYNHSDPFFHGTGIEFTGIAKAHYRLLQDYIAYQRANELQRILATIRRNRRH